MQGAPDSHTPILVLVAAASENHVIGLAGGMPWSLPRDLAHFKSTTIGHAVIMGRRTFDEIQRPLPGRLNIVVTRQPEWSRPGVETAENLDAAIQIAEHAAPGDTHMIIGGGQIYRLALPRAQRIELTRIHAHIEGDTSFPELGDEWTLQRRVDHPADERNAHAISFLSYRRSPVSNPD